MTVEMSCSLRGQLEQFRKRQQKTAKLENSQIHIVQSIYATSRYETDLIISSIPYVIKYFLTFFRMSCFFDKKHQMSLYNSNSNYKVAHMYQTTVWQVIRLPCSIYLQKHLQKLLGVKIASIFGVGIESIFLSTGLNQHFFIYVWMVLYRCD